MDVSDDAGVSSTEITPGGGPGSVFSMVLASDLHTEFIARAKDAAGNLTLGTLFEAKAPFLALLGDIGCPIGDAAAYHQVLATASGIFKHVWLVSGNHEFYNFDRHITYDDDEDGSNPRLAHYGEVQAKLRSLCAAFPNVSYMDRHSGPQWVTPAGDILTAPPPPPLHGACVRVIGCTLWTHVPQYARAATKRFMQDYAVILPPPDEQQPRLDAAAPGVGPAVESPVPPAEERRREAVMRFLAQEHEADLGYLQEQVRASTLSGEGASVVLTHHAPSFHGTSHPRFGSPMHNHSSHGFASSCEHLFASFGCAAAMGARAEGMSRSDAAAGSWSACPSDTHASSEKVGAGDGLELGHCRSNSNVAVWAYGHTHFNNDQVLHGTRLVSNQQGHKWVAGEAGEDVGRPFDPGFVVAVSLGKQSASVVFA